MGTKHGNRAWEQRPKDFYFYIRVFLHFSLLFLKKWERTFPKYRNPLIYKALRVFGMGTDMGTEWEQAWEQSGRFRPQHP